MKNNLRNSLKFLAIVLSVLISEQAFAKFAYEGHLSNLADAPIANQASVVRVSILGPSTGCIIFQETHSVTTDSKGFFAVLVGGGTDVDGLPNAFDGVFLNDLSAVTGMAACSYTSAAGHSRRMQIEVSTNGGSTYENLGMITLGKVPQAAHADTVGGFDAAKLMKVSSGTAPTLTSADVTNFNQLIAGTSSQYIQTGNNGVTAATATAPLVSTGGATPNLSLAQATAAVSGFLASSDFTIFNNKQAALGFTPLNPANNLSDVANLVTARTNLGLGTSATANVGTTTGTVAAGDDTRIVNALQSGVAFITGSTIKAPNGTMTAPSHTFSVSPSTGIFSPTTNEMGFSTAGADRIRITASGNVGIGTNTPNAKLEVVGGLNVGNAITGGSSIQNMRICSGTNPILISPTNINGIAFDITCNGVSVNSVVNCTPNTSLPSTVSWTAQIPTTPPDTIRVTVTNTTTSGSVAATVNWRCLVAD